MSEPETEVEEGAGEPPTWPSEGAQVGVYDGKAAPREEEDETG